MTAIKKDPYATAEESARVIKPDTRTAAQKKLGQLQDDAGLFEQGAEYSVIMNRIALHLIEQNAELLDALQDVTALLEQILMVRRGEHHEGSIGHKARAAIAKATK